MRAIVGEAIQDEAKGRRRGAVGGKQRALSKFGQTASM
jgi:hypothetical protein